MPGVRKNMHAVNAAWRHHGILRGCLCCILSIRAEEVRIQMPSEINLPLEGAFCPLPIQKFDRIVIGHGSGGLMTRELINRYFLPHFSNPSLLAGNDFAEIANRSGGRLILSTDAHIVSPLFFAGGDIGRLSVSGTVNDISMSGGIPLCLTASFIIEEGFSTSDLERIISSMANTAREAEVPIVAGDTKVVEKGKADGLFITTSGLAWVPDNLHIGGANAKPGDAVLISGTLGDHGIAVLTARGDLGFETEVQSDVAPLNNLIEKVVRICPDIHVLRDPTRGGLATTLNEIALQSNVGILLNEEIIPVQLAVRTACELLGYDPLYVANEGKVIVILPQSKVPPVLKAMRSHPYGKGSVQIGNITTEPSRRVLMKTRIGGTRVLDMLAGEMLPRIC